MDHQTLAEAAIQAKKGAIAPYSKFPVGAALLAENETVIAGCNIESSSYGLTICAERVALFKALSDGHRTFQAMAIATDLNKPCPPCGACRQVLWDFARSIELVLVDSTGAIMQLPLADVFPHAFDQGYFHV